MTAPRGARRGRLSDRVVLVLGAGDPCAQAVALRLAALGASLVLAGPTLPPLLVTAGLAAAGGGTARVVETPAPPLGGTSLLEEAARAWAPPTDAVVAAGAFASGAQAEEALLALVAALPRRAEVVLVEARPAGGSKALAAAVGDRFLASAGEDEGPVPPSPEQG